MTDPARTTKDERDMFEQQPFTSFNRHPDFPSAYANTNVQSAWNGWEIRAKIAADAADALRAQVAALQAENERLHERLEDNFAWQQDDYGNDIKVAFEPGSIPDGISCRDETIKMQDEQIAWLKAELAAAQAKLAVPVPKDVEDLIAWLRAKWRRHGEIEDRNARDALAALAHDNAALRTKAEALEQDVEDLKHDIERALVAASAEATHAATLESELETMRKAKDGKP